LGYVFYPITVGNRGAPIFLDDQSHFSPN
jgi:hypothetical protein